MLSSIFVYNPSYSFHFCITSFASSFCYKFKFCLIFFLSSWEKRLEQSCNKKPYQDAVNHKLKMMKNLDEKISNIRIKDLAFAI